MGARSCPAQYHPALPVAAARGCDRQRADSSRAPGGATARTPGAGALPARVVERAVRDRPVSTVGADHRPGTGTTGPGVETSPARPQTEALRLRFRPRPTASAWAVTRLSRQGVDQRLLAAPFTADTPTGEDNRRRGARIVLDWLATQPGETWQQRWLASGAQADGRSDWRSFPLGWRKATTSWDCRFDPKVLGAGLLSLICADLIRPDLAWLLTTATPKRLATEMAVGDFLEVLGIAAQVCDVAHYHSPYFYQLLHACGVLGEGSAPTVRALGGPRQLSVEQLIDRCGIACRPVRALLLDYPRERQARIDHVTLVRLADAPGRLFWLDLEIHHPGIDSLRLAPAVAAGWKQRIATKTLRRAQPDGSVSDLHTPRHSAINVLAAVRAFYLDIAQWATDDPARWGPWAVPCPIKAGELPHRKEAARRKSRMDARTRERLPVLPTLIAAVATQRTATADRLTAAAATSPGQGFL